MKKEKSCGCIVINDEKQFLLIKQSPGNYWGFPKGHMEKGEDEKTTALRELKEETNIDAKILYDKRFVIEYFVKERKTDKIVVYFIAKALNDDIVIDPNEVNGYGWFSKEDALEKITYDDIEALFIRVLKYLEMKENDEI